jgi:hypothetical protein
LTYPSSTTVLGPAVTGVDGVTALMFSVPQSISGGTVVEVNATVTYQQQVYTTQTCFNVIASQPMPKGIVLCT